MLRIEGLSTQACVYLQDRIDEERNPWRWRRIWKEVRYDLRWHEFNDLYGRDSITVLEFYHLSQNDPDTLDLFLTVPGSFTAIEHGKIDKKFIKELAKKIVSEIDKQECVEHQEEKAYDYCNKFKLTPPTQENKIDRLMDEKWWQRKLRRRLPNIVLEFHRQRQEIKKYVDETTKHCLSQLITDNLEWLHDQEIISKADPNKKFPMIEVVKSSEESRIALFFAKVKSLEIKGNNETCAMFTITVPGGWRAGRDDYHTIRECLEHLTKIENQVSARIAKVEKKEGRTLNAPRVKCTQPHRDGTPHRHIFVAGDEEDILMLEQLYKDAALKVLPDEAGADEHRFKSDYPKEFYEKYGEIDKAKDAKFDRKGFSRYVSRYATRLAQKELYKIEQNDITLEKTREILDENVEDVWHAATGARRFSFSGLPFDYIWKAIYKQTAHDYFETVPRDAEGNILQGFEAWIYDNVDNKFIDIVFAVAEGNYTKFQSELAKFSYEPLCEEEENKYGEIVKKNIGVMLDNVEFLHKVEEYDICPMCRDDFDTDEEDQVRLLGTYHTEILASRQVGVIDYEPSSGDSLDHDGEKDAIPPP